MTESNIGLPPFAKIYLRPATGFYRRRVVEMFHAWLVRTGNTLGALTKEDVEDFVSAPTGLSRLMTRNDSRREVRLYLGWIEEHGLAGPFKVQVLDGYYRKPVPYDVRRFLQFLAPTRRPSTVKNCRGILCRFHEWLRSRGIAIGNVDRDICLAWAQKLHDAGLHPTTRFGHLLGVRKYLDWLWERDAIPAPGRALIFASDLPKKPDYLPRPLPPQADQELQSRLKQSQSPLALGLYVMRRTGLRVGELRRLERDCVRDDHSGMHFLKVPLGKLNNERLVPLDDTTLAAVTELQGRLRPKDSPWLIAGARGRPVSARTYQLTLVQVAGDLPLAERLTTHRLRHTFATSLINGGMSLMGIMKLLGHRDYHMTLRYTKIADETVGREYFEALSRVAERYELPRLCAADPAESDPAALLKDAICWITKHLCVENLEPRAKLLIRRLQAATEQLERLRTAVQPSR